ncbi:hypothetical protein CDSE_0598 [Candidatus Kinetoplastibacterium desouzaii TCC079E]|uniref:Lipoate--protein ligase n=1 Tax=Candidatus Kinetoplastidibacterium desouzai TCC079E TaxID=1208919 RepID=M1L2C3_9PROT|nr:hypothetical protein [Candidatus Kinetoplastibacterium desouzaii]AGF46898.1 hypothetical protein CDSE_0598 [Candidatus Kinetoplastibacterium desouzaii TCC079E]
MHGEYKVPGGKLVAADFEINSENQIYNIYISGDFFLEPPETIDIINSSLEGISIKSTELVIKEKIESNLPKNTKLLGFSCEAIAIAIKKALE